MTQYLIVSKHHTAPAPTGGGRDPADEDNHMTSLVDKVDALRRFFGKSFAELDLIPAVAAMNAAMSLVGSGSLTAQVDTLVASTGVRVASPPAPAEIPAAASAAASGGASSTAAGKKRARSPAAQQATSTANLGTPTGKRAQKLTDFTGFTKLLILRMAQET
jgi:hypothetical protein